MAYLSITANVPDEIIDLDDSTGLTEEGFEDVMDVLMGLGLTDIDIKPRADT